MAKDFIPEGFTIWARQTLNSEIFFYKPDKWFKIWFYLVNRVNYKDTKLFKRGECLVSYNDIMSATGATKKQVERCVAWLEKESMLGTVRTTRGCKRFVVNYAKFQDVENYKKDGEGTDVAIERRLKGDSEGVPIVKEGKKEKKEKKGESFAPPTLEDVSEYIAEKGYNVDAVRWWNFYDSKGWMVGKNKMKKWRSAVASWNTPEVNDIRSDIENWKRVHGSDVTFDKVNTKYGIEKAMEHKSDIYK